MDNEAVAGIDIGGTKIAIALDTLQGERLASERLPTAPELGANRILENILQSIEKMLLQTGAELKAIGMGCPGTVDIERGLVLSPSNLPGWNKFPIVELVEKRFNVVTVLDNDANAAALGEYFYGAGCGFKEMLYVTISTGIGGALISDGILHHGVGASAGEVGHMIVVPDGFPCRCGAFGCLETIGSGLNIARRMKEKLAAQNGSNSDFDSEITAAMVVESVKNGDETAIEVWDETCRYLAIGIGNAITLTAPEVVVIGGGVSAADELLLEPLRREIKRNVKMPPIEKIKIVKASLGGESGICGALMLARQAYQKHLI
jgi:glucokinase